MVWLLYRDFFAPSANSEEASVFSLTKNEKAEDAMESIDSLDTITDIDTNRLKTVA